MTRWLCAIALCVLSGTVAAGDEEHPVTLWRIAGETNSIDLLGSIHLLREAKVAVSPGVGFGPSGDRHVRFALVENEHRVGQAVRGIRKALTRLGGC